MDENGISKSVIGAAIEVHSILGVGLLESAHESALAIELEQRGLVFRRQLLLPVQYKGVEVGDGYRVDFLVEERVVVEVKAVSHLAPVHTAQVLTYLRLMGKRLGLLLNFHAESMRAGVKRIANQM